MLACAQRGRGHILQQNRAVLFVCLLKTIRCPCVPKAVKATFCSKTGPFFSCGCSNFCVAAGTAQTRPTEPGSRNGPSSSCMNIFLCFGRLRTEAEDKCSGWDVVGYMSGSTGVTNSLMQKISDFRRTYFLPQQFGRHTLNPKP